MADTTFGIDLGAYCSSIAFINESGKPEIIPSMDGEPTTPSFVYFDTEYPDYGNIVVGECAKEMLGHKPEGVVQFDKTKLKEPEFAIKLPDGTSRSAIEFCGFFLAKLANNAEAMTGIPVKKVVLTHSALSGADELKTLRMAGLWAGFDSVDLVSEPLAVVAAYMGRIEHPENILVFDFGGTSLDVTIIRMLPPDREEVAVIVAARSNSQLGGTNWDMALAEILAKKWSEATGEGRDLLKNQESKADLMLVAEKMKKRLSRRMSDKARISAAGEVPNAVVEVTRDEFESATVPLIERAIQLARETLIDAAKRASVAEFRVDTILCAGGGSIMPQVSSRLEREFGIRPHLCDPQECVAKGAAIFSKLKWTRPLSHTPPQLLLKSYGILVKHMLHGDCIADVVFNVLLRQQGVLEAHYTQDFHTSHPDMRVLEIDVVESESGCWDNMSPGGWQEREELFWEVAAPIVHHVEIKLPPRLPAGETISVFFAAEDKEHVTVTAVLKQTWSPLMVNGGSIVATLPKGEEVVIE